MTSQAVYCLSLQIRQPSSEENSDGNSNSSSNQSTTITSKELVTMSKSSSTSSASTGTTSLEKGTSSIDLDSNNYHQQQQQSATPTRQQKATSIHLQKFQQTSTSIGTSTTISAPSSLTKALQQQQLNHQQQSQQQQQHSNIILVRGARTENGQIILQNSHELLSLLNAAAAANNNNNGNQNDNSSADDKPQQHPQIILQHPRLKTSTGNTSTSNQTILLQTPIKSATNNANSGHHHDSSSTSTTTTAAVLLQSTTGGIKKNVFPEGSIILQQRLNNKNSIVNQHHAQQQQDASTHMGGNSNNTTSTATATTTSSGPFLLQTLKRLDKSQSILVFRNPSSNAATVLSSASIGTSTTISSANNTDGTTSILAGGSTLTLTSATKNSAITSSGNVSGTILTHRSTATKSANRTNIASNNNSSIQNNNSNNGNSGGRKQNILNGNCGTNRNVNNSSNTTRLILEDIQDSNEQQQRTQSSNGGASTAGVLQQTQQLQQQQQQQQRQINTPLGTDGEPIKLPDNLESLPRADHFPTQRHRWNTNEEIAAILISFDKHSEWQSKEVRTRPKSGSLLLYSRKKVRYRRDGYCWKKRKDGKTTREDHMKLKVQGTECIYGCYVHSAILPTFHRRCYWLLQNPDIVLVHYLNVPYPDDNKMAIITPSLSLWGDKKEWTKEELVSQLKPMFFSEDDPEGGNDIEISFSPKTAETVEAIVSQLMEKQRLARQAALVKQLECGCPDSTCADGKSCAHPMRRMGKTLADKRSDSSNQVTSTTPNVLVGPRFYSRWVGNRDAATDLTQKTSVDNQSAMQFQVIPNIHTQSLTQQHHQHQQQQQQQQQHILTRHHSSHQLLPVSNNNTSSQTPSIGIIGRTTSGHHQQQQQQQQQNHHHQQQFTNASNQGNQINRHNITNNNQISQIIINSNNSNNNSSSTGTTATTGTGTSLYSQNIPTTTSSSSLSSASTNIDHSVVSNSNNSISIIKNSNNSNHTHSNQTKLQSSGDINNHTTTITTNHHSTSSSSSTSSTQSSTPMLTSVSSGASSNSSSVSSTASSSTSSSSGSSSASSSTSSSSSLSSASTVVQHHQSNTHPSQNHHSQHAVNAQQHNNNNSGTGVNNTHIPQSMQHHMNANQQQQQHQTIIDSNVVNQRVSSSNLICNGSLGHRNSNNNVNNGNGTNNNSSAPPLVLNLSQISASANNLLILNGNQQNSYICQQQPLQQHHVHHQSNQHRNITMSTNLVPKTEMMDTITTIKRQHASQQQSALSEQQQQQQQQHSIPDFNDLNFQCDTNTRQSAAPIGASATDKHQDHSLVKELNDSLPFFNETLDLSQEDIQKTLIANMPSTHNSHHHHHQQNQLQHNHHSHHSNHQTNARGSSGTSLIGVGANVSDTVIDSNDINPMDFIDNVCDVGEIVGETSSYTSGSNSFLNDHSSSLVVNSNSILGDPNGCVDSLIGNGNCSDSNGVHIPDDVYINLDAFDMFVDDLEFDGKNGFDHDSTLMLDGSTLMSSSNNNNSSNDSTFNQLNGSLKLGSLSGNADHDLLSLSGTHNTTGYNITDYSPEWAYPEGGVKVLVTGPWNSTSEYTVLFDSFPVKTHVVQEGVLRCFCPAHEVGMVSLQVACDGYVISNSVNFEYKAPPIVETTYDSAANESLYKFTLLDRLLSIDQKMQIKSEPKDVPEEGVVIAQDNFEDRLVTYCQHLTNKPWLSMACGNWSINYKGMTLLHLASALGYAKLVCAMLSWRSENPNLVLDTEIDALSRDVQGYTPLACACSRGHFETALILYKWNHNSLNIKTNFQQTPLEIAKANSFQQLFDELKRLENNRITGQLIKNQSSSIALNNFTSTTTILSGNDTQSQLTISQCNTSSLSSISSSSSPLSSVSETPIATNTDSNSSNNIDNKNSNNNNTNNKNNNNSNDKVIKSENIQTERSNKNNLNSKNNINNLKNNLTSTYDKSSSNSSPIDENSCNNSNGSNTSNGQNSNSLDNDSSEKKQQPLTINNNSNNSNDANNCNSIDSNSNGSNGGKSLNINNDLQSSLSQCSSPNSNISSVGSNRSHDGVFLRPGAVASQSPPSARISKRSSVDSGINMDIRTYSRSGKLFKEQNRFQSLDTNDNFNLSMDSTFSLDNGIGSGSSAGSLLSPMRKMDFALCEVSAAESSPQDKQPGCTSSDDEDIAEQNLMSENGGVCVGESDAKVLTLAEHIIAAMPERIKNESEDIMSLSSPMSESLHTSDLNDSFMEPLLDSLPSSQFDHEFNFEFSDNSYRYHDVSTPCSSLSPASSGPLQSPASYSILQEPTMSSPSPPPSTKELTEFLHASNASLRPFEADFSNLTLTDREQRELYEAAKCIQKAYRSYKGRKKLEEQDKERSAAIVIQNYYRRYKQFALYNKQRTHAALIIQNGYRSYCENKRFKKSQSNSNESGQDSQCLQKYYKSYQNDQQQQQQNQMKNMGSGGMTSKEASPSGPLKRTYSQRTQNKAARKIQQFMRQSKMKLQRERAEKERLVHQRRAEYLLNLQYQGQQEMEIIRGANDKLLFK